jgi:hypothetical protein
MEGFSTFHLTVDRLENQMKLCKGDMFVSVPDEPVFFTANNVVKNNGELVMGAGAALACKRHHPELPLRFGRMLQGLFDVDRYGVLYDPATKRGAFQVKKHYKDDADLDIIWHSAVALIGVTRLIGRVNVNFPGIGLGNLGRDEVLEHIQYVWRDEDVCVWEL